MRLVAALTLCLALDLLLRVMRAGSAMVRDQLGTYNAAWYAAGFLCLIATGLALMVRAPGAGLRRWRLAT